MPLKVVSRAISANELGLTSLLELFGNAQMCFIKDGSGVIGWGEALKLSASGPDRFNHLEMLWRKTVSEATVTDAVNSQGSGLIAFGSMAFSDLSAAESVLVVPKLIIGFAEDSFFLTTVNISEDEALKLITESESLDHIEFQPGQISPETFSANVNQALELINAAKLSKIVLARDLVAKVTNFCN